MQRFADDDTCTTKKFSGSEVHEIVDRNSGANADCYVSSRKVRTFARKALTYQREPRRAAPNFVIPQDALPAKKV